jgi:NAD(P)-dependent dehydrogenase (short-subunit alcohol dehydrogenase family)
VGTAIETFGGLDILVNVAGIVRDKMIFNMAEDDWDAVVRVHIKGHFNTIKPAAAYWRSLADPAANHRIINFTSTSGLYGAVGQPNYAAEKMGIVGLTYSCANALARYGVTSNVIAPSAQTRMISGVPADRRRTPEGAEFAPENVAPVVTYLATPESRWCNGRVIGAPGYSVTLFSNPEPIRQVVTDGPWEIDRLGQLLETSFKPVVEASVNPHRPAPERGTGR